MDSDGAVERLTVQHGTVGHVAGRFVKGHGTGNDFVVLPDVDGVRELSPQAVAALCDRRTGIGGDGVLRVVRVAALPDGVAASLAGDPPGGLGGPGAPEWFMDYRNADGSVAEMCGNGIRVFVRYLQRAGLVDLVPGESVPVLTRAGVRRVGLDPDGRLRADMGPASFPAALVTVGVGHRSWEGTQVSMGNPHVVVFVDDLADAGDLRAVPHLRPALPSGANIEFVVRGKPSGIAMRVWERGVGETRSCGTGACAAAVATAREAGLHQSGPGAGTWEMDVRVPGGTLTVGLRPDGGIDLTGPAELVAEGWLMPGGPTDPASWLEGGDSHG